MSYQYPQERRSQHHYQPQQDCRGPTFSTRAEGEKYEAFQARAAWMIERYDELEGTYRKFSKAVTRDLNAPNPVARFTARAVFDPPPVPQVLEIRDVWFYELKQAKAALRSMERFERGHNSERLVMIFQEIETMLQTAERSLRKAEETVKLLHLKNRHRRQQHAVQRESREVLIERAMRTKTMWHDIYVLLEAGENMPYAVEEVAHSWSGVRD
ncbi:hypothetical protein AOQ84DRAFT_230212 [Glonium stellatum]|uniref:Uncharacterized protein n=1 Tax=Glonium stellatum TaxID=574774 RepID=A0A8E2F5X6_9PEZI|nr:hypothetical protein AOQ84DRAFT_230212 [Glonium stellatum]